MKKLILFFIVLSNICGCGVSINSGDDKLIYEDVLKKYDTKNKV
jgi:hypothetical protein